jgi:hypothetical protein
MTSITLDGDNVVVKWNGRKGRGSLYQIAAEGNAKNVNKLSIAQCLAVYICVKVAPFPMGSGEKVYRMVLADVEAGKQPKMVEMAEKMGLGAVRKSLVEAAGGGFNAPHDSYITIAAECETPACVA